VLSFIHKKHYVWIGLQEGLDEIYAELLSGGVAGSGDLDHFGLIKLDLRFEVIGCQPESGVLNQFGFYGVHPVEEVHLGGYGGQHHVITFDPCPYDLGQCIV